MFSNEIFAVKIRWFALLGAVLVCCSASVSLVVAQKDGAGDISVADAVGWHPEVINLAHPGVRFVFKLPQKKEQDQSGVANLFFQCRETGAIHLLDSLDRNNSRVYNNRISSGNYDAILLYKNGKYIRYDSVVIEKNKITEVDMAKLDIKPFSSESIKWLALRSIYNPMYISPIHPAYGVAGWHISDADTGKWHPEEFFIVYPDMKLTFKFPYEKDQSGFANLLFIDKGTGNALLLDTVKNNERYCNLLSGKYDAILLYNNGKYIRRNDVSFEKNSNAEVDMTQLDIQLSDPDSQHWLTLRAFNAAVGDRFLRKSYTTASEKKVRGYVFAEDGPGSWSYFIVLRPSTDGIRKSVTHSIDGYFEYDVSDMNTTLEIFCLGHGIQKIDVKDADTGIFVVMENELKNVNVFSGPVTPRITP